MQEILAAKGGTMGEKGCPVILPTWRLLYAANLRHGTDSFTSPPKGRCAEDFFALKNPTDSAGFEYANLGTRPAHYP